MKRGEKKIDKVQISFQFGWCDVNVICDGNKVSIKHRTEREKCYAATYIYSYLQYHTHMMLPYTKRSGAASCDLEKYFINFIRFYFALLKKEGRKLTPHHRI